MIDHRFKIFWIVWLAMFAVGEFIAVRNDKGGDTFSEFIWWLIDINKHPDDIARWIARAVVLCVLLWLIPHFMTKWRWW